MIAKNESIAGILQKPSLKVTPQQVNLQRAMQEQRHHPKDAPPNRLLMPEQQQSASERQRADKTQCVDPT